MKSVKYFATFLLVAFLVFSSGSAFASTFGGVSGRPAYPQANNPRSQSIFIYNLKPGQKVSDGLRVFNDTNQTQIVNLDSVDSELASGGVFTCKQAVEPKQDVGAWITFPSLTYTLSPNESIVVPFMISVPANKNLSVGEHDGCITIQPNSQIATKSNKAGIELSFRSAIRVSVTIPGKIVKQLTLTKVQVSEDASHDYQVTSYAKNTGNVSLDTSVQINLLSIYGSRLKSTKEGITPNIA